MRSYKKVSGMTAEIKITRCYGCGSLLQSINRYEAGYVSENRSEYTENLCDRCYRLRHPNGSKEQTIDADYINMINSAKANDALFFYIVDAFFWKGSISSNLNSLLKDARIILIINKTDILPDDFRKEEIKDIILKDFESQNLKFESVLFSSINDSDSVKDLMVKINELRNGKDVYFIGSSRVGKSALINEFLKFYNNETGRTITKEKVGDSEIYLTAIPLDNNATLYDTPGIFEPTTMVNQIDRKALRYVIPRFKVIDNEISIKDGESIIIGGLAIIDYSHSESSNIKMYFSKDINIEKVKTSRSLVEFNNMVSENKILPTSSTITSSENLVENKITIPETNNKVYVSIHGLGKFEIIGSNQELILHLPANVLFSFDE